MFRFPFVVSSLSSQFFHLSQSSFISATTCVCSCLRPFVSNPKLEHVGVLSDCRLDSNYEVAQTFLHRVFAYRGVILHPWKACVYKKTRQPKSKNDSSNGTSVGYVGPNMETYYQVLVDARDNANDLAICDLPYLKNPGREHYPLDIIPGMDYVSHSDVIPYTSVEHTPVFHDLFDKFIVRNKNQLMGTKTLSKWQELNHLWLELNNVYVETTDSIKVTAIPFFLGVKSLSKPALYWWRYCIRIENLEAENVKLCERHWRIISDGTVTKQSGRGVVGREPVLSVNKPAFQYSSQVYLGTPRGHMWGTYIFEKENGDQFEVCIPAFALESKLEVELGSDQHS